MKKPAQYIFSINTGRSGSDYLTNIFKHVSGCCSLHEPDPKGNRKEMRQFLRGRRNPMKRIAETKARLIKELMRDCQVYFESNHCFIKGFGWFLSQHLPEDRMGVIILKRDKSKIAPSYLKIGCSPLSIKGRRWVITPEMKHPLVKPPTTPTTYQCARVAKAMSGIVRYLVRKIFRKRLPDPQWLIDYELKCLMWSVEETHAQAEAFKKQFPAIKYYEVNIEDLNSLESVERMFAFFGCTGTETLSQVVGKPTNLKN